MRLNEVINTNNECMTYARKLENHESVIYKNQILIEDSGKTYLISGIAASFHARLKGINIKPLSVYEINEKINNEFFNTKDNLNLTLKLKNKLSNKEKQELLNKLEIELISYENGFKVIEKGKTTIYID